MQRTSSSRRTAAGRTCRATSRTRSCARWSRERASCATNWHDLGDPHMNINKRLIMLACTTALCSTAPTLHAQTPSATRSLEEVIVTARKRDETSLNVPVAVNVFTAADIQAAGIERAQGLIAPPANKCTA